MKSIRVFFFLAFLAVFLIEVAFLITGWMEQHLR